MKRVAIIGHFARGQEYLDGQTVKTKLVSQELKHKLGSQHVEEIDTHGGIKTLFKSPFQCFFALHNSQNVIILPAHNGLRVYSILLVLFNKIFRRKLHYVVIGGWLPRYLEHHACVLRALNCFNCIYVETNLMKKALEEKNLSNIYVMPNAKKLHILKEKNIISSYKRPYKLCTFSRVMKQKGINDIVKAVKEINKLYNEVIFLLDIYGPVDPLYKNEFTEMCKNFPKYIRYCGCVPSDESTSVLSDYYALVFPTRFYTEGIPGTIIDAFSSGLPVISSKWQNFSDLIDDGITGIGYDFGSYKHLKSTLIEIIANPNRLINMKKNCIREAEKYSIDKAISILLEQV